MAQCLQIGIIGLPNVGKSTLFNALLKKQQALAANYPFATIEPNVGVVPVPDQRLDRLAEVEKEELKLSNLPPKKPATVEFVDIAGLVKGASEGAGLGNKFLSHIREVAIIAHVIRAFEDQNVIKEGAVDPKTDHETIQTELMLADIQSISNRKSQKSNPQLKSQNELIERIEKSLNQGVPVRNLSFNDEEKEIVDQMFLLSAKPEIIVLNVAEKDYSREKIKEIVLSYSRQLEYGSENIIVISAKIEAELAELNEEEQREYLKQLGVEQSGLERLIKKAYDTLGLISFLTAGEIEVRAWTIKKGTNAQNASGVIHTDFIKNFIKAEIVPFETFIEYKGWKGAREAGKARFEGKDYIMQEGDVVEFKIGR